MVRSSLHVGFYIVASLLLLSPYVEARAAQEVTSGYSIAVVIPGVTAGSPLYEGLVKGAEQAILENDGASMQVFELGYNQTEWQDRIAGIVNTGRYDLIVSSNPATPYIFQDLVESFPEQHYLALDAHLDGTPTIATVLYNQIEQAFLLGHMAALVSKSDLGGEATNRVGLLIAQEYPAFNEMILPGFEKGIQAVDPAMELDLRILGNWYDANKAADITTSILNNGVKVVGTICGGANQGVFSVAEASGAFVVVWDSNQYARFPDTIVGCVALHQERLAYEKITEAINGVLAYGTAEVVSVAQGYVEFITDDPHYTGTVPSEIREQQKRLIADIENGAIKLETPK